MRRLTILGAAIVATAALGAIVATTASAATMPDLNPGKEGEKFTVTSGPGTLETKSKGSIECGSDKGRGLLISKTQKEAEVTIDFEKCKAFGIVGAHSLGDPSEVILFHGELVLCYLNKTNKEVGAVLHPLPIHIEVGGKLLEVIGWVIGRLTPIAEETRKYKISFAESKGVQQFTKCEGGIEETLLTSENGGTFERSGEASTQELVFENAQTLMA
jgi:hypothetical protein